jgi:hypothetical protein
MMTWSWYVGAVFVRCVSQAGKLQPEWSRLVITLSDDQQVVDKKLAAWIRKHALKLAAKAGDMDNFVTLEQFVWRYEQLGEAKRAANGAMDECHVHCVPVEVL